MEIAKIWQFFFDQRPDFSQLFTGAFNFKGYAAEAKKIRDFAANGKSEAISADTALNVI